MLRRGISGVGWELRIIPDPRLSNRKNYAAAGAIRVEGSSPNKGLRRKPTQFPAKAGKIHIQPCRLPLAIPPKKALMLQPDPRIAP
jgi:hypothetical protein